MNSIACTERHARPARPTGGIPGSQTREGRLRGRGWSVRLFAAALGLCARSASGRRGGGGRGAREGGLRVRGWSVRLFAAALVFCALFATGCSAGDDTSTPADAVREETTSPAPA